MLKEVRMDIKTLPTTKKYNLYVEIDENTHDIKLDIDFHPKLIFNIDNVLYKSRIEAKAIRAVRGFINQNKNKTFNSEDVRIAIEKELQELL